MKQGCRFIVKQKETGYFYQHPGEWVDAREKATDFGSSGEARRFCQTLPAGQILIIMDFGLPSLDVELPPW